MCGINLIFDSEQDLSWIKDMNQALWHRGPDAEGLYESPSQALTLGSRRLKIIDLDDRANMPYTSACGRYAMVYNGEIYNYKALLTKLKNYDLKSQTDGEVLFALLQQDGPSILEQCNGMFSFAFWDEQEKKLTLGRDRLGIKPLFYSHEQGKLYVSSEIKALKTLPGLSEGMDQQAAYHYLSLLSVPAPHSLHPKIKRFPAGQYAVFQDHRLCFHPYWNLSFSKRSRSQQDWKNKIRETLLKAIEKRLVSDVPIGLLLSAGIDSNILASIVKKEFNIDIHCYSLGFKGGEDESNLAQQTAKELQLPFHQHQLEAEELLAHIPKIIQQFSEPFGGGLPLWFLCQHIHKDITVGLTGTGGDELFGNYGRSQHTSPHLGPWRGIKTLLKKPDYLAHLNIEALSYTLEHGAPLGHFIHDKVYPTKEEVKQNLFKNPPSERTDQYFEKLLWQHQQLNTEDRIFYLEMKTQLSQEFLYSQDILSMAHHMELRVPFLDHDLVELMASVPSHIRSSSHQPKAWMKEIFKKDIPMHILNQPKRGFMVPYGNWMRRELKSSLENLLNQDLLAQQNLFEPAPIKKIWQAHQDGQDHTYTLWSFFMFQVWYCQHQNIELKWTA